MNIFSDLLNFIFPANCVTCSKILTDHEKILCSDCYYSIPRTNFHDDPENAVLQLFWGRVNISHATAFFYFNKGSLYQKLIHDLKYKGRSDIGIEAGKMFGAEIRESVFNTVDLVIPVPLHRKKLRKRGYNQSEMIARGICMSLGKPLIPDLLERVDFTGTQTRRSRYDRFTNVTGCFRLNMNYKHSGKHILLVDDVITTGSTLEACAETLLESGSQVSVATLAVA
jgi:ComF family protein